MIVQEFDAEIEGMGPKEAWGHIVMPFDVPSVFDAKGICPVRGTANGYEFRTSLMPMHGKYYLMFNKEMKTGSGTEIGDVVRIVIQRDFEPKTVETPTDLAIAMQEHPTAATVYESLSYSHKKEFVDWINSAKQAETRQRRIGKAVEMIAEKKRRS